MTAYHYAQLVLALGVIAVVVGRVRQIFGRTKVDATALVRGVVRGAKAGDRARVERLLRDAGDSWLADVARAALVARDGDPDALTVDEVLAEQRYEASRGMLTLRIAMTLGSMSGLAGALLEYARLPAARHSLLGLVPGLPEERALHSAMIAVGLGVSIAIFAGLALRRLRRRAKALYLESLEAAAQLEQELE